MKKPIMKPKALLDITVFFLTTHPKMVYLAPLFLWEYAKVKK